MLIRKMQIALTLAKLTIIALTTAACAPKESGAAPDAPGAPEVQLHTIQNAEFTHSYSCYSGALPNYDGSALFLAPSEKSRNAPSLLFNGTCGSEPYVSAVTAGDDLATIADLGDVEFDRVTTLDAFRMPSKSGGFRVDVPAIEGHTYSVLINKKDLRALYIFRIDKIVRDEKTKGASMAIRYIVKQYQPRSGTTSPGWSWKR